MIECFFIEPTGWQRVYLRRYRSTNGEDKQPCPGNHGYHNAEVLVAEAEEEKDPRGYIKGIPEEKYIDDPRWPTRCECGYEFSITDDADKFQVFTVSIYKRADTGEQMTLRDAPVGAMWDARWLNDSDDHSGPGRRSLHVRLPGGHDWNIDSRASNCDSPCARCTEPYHACKCEYPQGYQDSRPHKCWIRHGDAPKLTVDKSGVTCGAGGGSIIVPGWHGFLRNGFLVPC